MGVFSLRSALSKFLGRQEVEVTDEELFTPGRIRNAYLHGYSDFAEDDHLNPYREGSKEFYAWKIGYDQNDREGSPM